MRNGRWVSSLRVLVIGTALLFSVIMVADKTIAGEIPKCSPKKSDFSGGDIKTHSTNWRYHRDPNSSGHDYGDDYLVPDPDANALVEWEARETSCNRCGRQDVRLVEKNKGRISYPAGVHAGARIDTGRNKPGGAGGSYTGVITMSYVPYAKWRQVFFEKYAECQ